MRLRFLLAAAAAVGAMGLGGCGSSTVCDRNDSFDPSGKAGDCSVQLPGRVLGSKNACTDALASCSDSDRAALEEVITCWEALPTCSAADQAGWDGQKNACYAKAAGVSEACKTAFFGGSLPGEGTGDGGTDGTVDAGTPWDTADAGALDVIAVADDQRVALAWTASQPGPVQTWQVDGFTAADVPVEASVIASPATMNFTEQVGEATRRKYYVRGLDGMGGVVSGVPDAGSGTGDGGTGCSQNAECPADKICNIASGACETLPCSTENPEVCTQIEGYACTLANGICERQTVTLDGGIDAGMGEQQMPASPKPFISELVEITTAPAQFSANREISVFPARNIDGVAIDSARQFAVMEQEGQIYGHTTQNRGANWKLSPLDPAGSKPKATYEPQSRTVFLCYNALGGIRIRASSDDGRTFPGALDILNPTPDDGGAATPIQHCDIAPWTEGTALVTAIEGDEVKLWTVTKDLQVQGTPSTVFSSSEAIFSPQRLAIATLPSEGIVHVLMGVTRVTSGGANDSEVIGMYRDSGTGGVFKGPLYMNKPLVYGQREPAVAIDPISKRAIAAFISRESTNNGPLKDTVYVAYWHETQDLWLTGPDLNVFAQDMYNSYIVMPDRASGESWLARSPSVNFTPEGRGFLSFIAGTDASGQAELYPWVVEFGFDAPNKVIGSIKGWYLPPAQKAGEGRVATLSGDDYAGPILAVDPQISHYLFYVEGVGTGGQTANRPMAISRPK